MAAQAATAELGGGRMLGILPLAGSRKGGSGVAGPKLTHSAMTRCRIGRRRVASAGRSLPLKTGKTWYFQALPHTVERFYCPGWLEHLASSLLGFNIYMVSRDSVGKHSMITCQKPACAAHQGADGCPMGGGVTQIVVSRGIGT